MLLLFETSAGHALFEVKQSAKLRKASGPELWEAFSGEGLSEKLQLKAFSAFKDTSEAVCAATEFVESKLGKPLRTFLKKHVVKAVGAKAELGVADAKLGALIKEKLGIQVLADSFVNEALRGVREFCDPEVGSVHLKATRLGLSHSLSRYKLKFSPDKVDTMVVQAVGLLDDLDKEVNTYAMRVKEWYGWHFPELAGLLHDNVTYANVVLKVGLRKNCKDVSAEELAEIVADAGQPPDETLAMHIKDTAEISMGTEIDDADIKHVRSLAEQVVELSSYRARLAEYLRARMAAVAPNLTVLVGELVGARLVQRAGSVLNLAKHPASTLQILGAEKALFRALKTKHDTPKYGLIYHASLVGQASPKNKGKISRVLAAKCSLAVRVDALADDDADDAAEEKKGQLGAEMRAKVEMRLRQLEGDLSLSVTKKKDDGRKLVQVLDADKAAAPASYNVASDVLLGKGALPGDDDGKAPKKKKKKKASDDANGDDDDDDGAPKKKKKKKASDDANDDDDDGAAPKKEKKKKKRKADDGTGEATEAPSTEKKKKKKKEKPSEEGA